MIFRITLHEPKREYEIELSDAEAADLIFSFAHMPPLVPGNAIGFGRVRIDVERSDTT